MLSHLCVIWDTSEAHTFWITHTVELLLTMKCNCYKISHSDIIIIIAPRCNPHNFIFVLDTVLRLAHLVGSTAHVCILNLFSARSNGSVPKQEPSTEWWQTHATNLPRWDSASYSIILSET